MRLTSFASLAVLAVAACSGSSNSGPSGTSGTGTSGTTTPPANTIIVDNNNFNPTSLTVAVGTTVTFTWADLSRSHNVSNVAPQTIPVSPGFPTLLDGPRSFTVTFTTAGTYVFFCTNHGSSTSGMRGTITVQ